MSAEIQITFPNLIQFGGVDLCAPHAAERVKNQGDAYLLHQTGDCGADHASLWMLRLWRGSPLLSCSASSSPATSPGLNSWTSLPPRAVREFISSVSWGGPEHLGDDILCLYKASVRAELEYACAVWHTSLSTEQSDQIERLQKRGLRIVYQMLHTMKHWHFLGWKRCVLAVRG